MSTPIKITELLPLVDHNAPSWEPWWHNEEDTTAVADALPSLLRLARAADRYAWMLSKDGPGEDEEHVVIEIVAEWKAALAAFDFTTEEPSA